MKGHRVRWAAILLAVGVAALGAPGIASAGEYQVAQCHPANASHEASSYGSNRGDYIVHDECAASPDHALKVLPDAGVPAGHLGYWFWQAPPGTRIVAVDAEARLRKADGHKARLYMADNLGQRTDLIASGEDGPTGFRQQHWNVSPGGAGAARFYAALVCDNGGSPCGASPEAKTFIRNVVLTLRDTAAPTVSVTGSPEPWVRGSFDTESTFADVGSGLEARDASVNGVGVASRLSFSCRRIGATGFVSVMLPCPTSRIENSSLNSASFPFHDGSNRLTVCARDLSTGTTPNVRCGSLLVPVDNTPPDLAFRDAQDIADPELIRLSAVDVTSGLVGSSGLIEYRRVGTAAWDGLPTTFRDGELQARVDSESQPEGIYEFRASSRDVAGNSSATLLRSNGTPMRLHFPLKQEADLDAFFPGGQTQQLAGYGEPSKVRGFLRRPDGSPIADQQIVIQEVFDDGSLVQRRTQQVSTDAGGAFSSSIPGGPSRQVTVSYAGSRRYMDDLAPELDYNVRSQVSLSVERQVRAGNAVHFRGRVGRYFARIPTGGKLVELQFKKRARTWNTAKQALGTTSRGRIQIPYRFRRYYTEPVTFVFRLKVTRESSWPYRVPANSKPVQVTVLPRRR